MNPFVSIFRSLVRQIGQKRRVAICTVVGSHGSTPQAPGASMLLHENMTTEGTLGGGCVEAEVRKQAYELLRRNKSALLTFRLDHDYGWDDGLICGGTMRVAVMPINAEEDVHRRDACATGGVEKSKSRKVETGVGDACAMEESRQFLRAADDLEANRPTDVTLRVENDGRLQEYRLHIEAPARLVIAGAGHVGAELARMAANLDFDVAIFDDRGDMMGPRRLPPPIRPVVGDIEKSLREWPIDAHTYVVIVTRGHNHDEQALHAVIDSPARYIGMIGSRRKVKLIFDDLAALGVDPAKLAKVHAPIGLAIGAVTVPEIAVSILAQLIEVRRTEKPTRVEGPFDVGAVGQVEQRDLPQGIEDPTRSANLPRPTT